MATQAQRSKRKRVVVVGLGDTGVLVAIELSGDYDVVGITPKSCFVSGQELGTRLASPERWKENYCLEYQQFEKLDPVEIIQGLVSTINLDAGDLLVRLESGALRRIPYDALVIASGVTNGFWREPSLETRESIDGELERVHQAIARCGSLAIVGGGASGVSCAANISRTWPDKKVSLYFSGETVLPGYHERVRRRVENQLMKLGVRLQGHHRAEIPEGFDLQKMTTQPICWSTGQAPTKADLVLWTLGKVRPNSAYLPDSLLCGDGFVKVDEYLRVPGHANIFAVGDIAASDPLRSSARNWGFRTVAHNVRMFLGEKEGGMKPYKASVHRWGSVLGVQPDGLEVFQPNGRRFRFPRWSVDSLLFPFVLNKMIYRGVRQKSAGGKVVSEK